MTVARSLSMAWACCLAVVLAAGPDAAAGPSARREALAAQLADVDRLLDAGRAEEALARLAALARDHGDEPLFGWQIRDRRGLALLRAGQPREALPLLEETVGRQPLSATAHRNLADALRRLGRRGRSLAEYAQAVELDPRDPRLRLEHAHSLAGFRMWARAAEEYRAAGHLGAGPAADSGLAACLREQGRHEEALAPLRRLYADDPSAARRRDLAAGLQAAGRDSALVALLAPIDPAALDAGELRALVQAEAGAGSDPAASRRFARALAGAGAGPAPVARDAGFWGRVALNLIEAEAWDLALAAVDRAVALAPDDPVHRTNRVVILQGLGRQEEARRAWEEIQRHSGAGEDS